MLKINYLIGGISLININQKTCINNYDISDNDISIYLLKNSYFKIICFGIILFFKGLIIKPQINKKCKRLKVRRKFFKIDGFKDNQIYYLYLSNFNNKDVLIFDKGNSIFNIKDLDNQNLCSIDYQSKSYSNQNLKIIIPRNIESFIHKYKDNLLCDYYKQVNSDFSNSNNVKIAINTLEKAVAIIEQIGFKYWLEGGTCLGAIRNGKLIPWDHDLDVGIEFYSEEKIIQLIKLLKKYFRVEKRRFTKKYEKEFGNYRMLKVYPLEKSAGVISKLDTTNINSENDFCLDIFIIYKAPLNSNKDNWVYKYVVFDKMGYHDKKYLDKTNEIQFYNKKYQVPDHVEEWLETKYGSNWRIPKKQWDVQLDDKTLNRN